MLGALDGDGGPERCTEYRELGAAETLAQPGRGADRAVVLGQKIGAVRQRPPVGHITFFAAQFGELRHLLSDVAEGGKGRRIAALDLALAQADQAVETLFP